MIAPTPEPKSTATDPSGSARALGRRLRAIQAGLSAAAIRDVAISAPLWALSMSAMFGGPIPEIGVTPMSRTWPWIVLCVGVGAAVFALWKWIAARVRDDDCDGQRATLLVTAAYFSVGFAWSLVTFIFWDPGNVANHAFLIILAMGAVALFLPSRSGNFGTVVAATTPVLGMIWGHLLLESSAFDTVMAVILPLWTVQLHLESWRACRSVTASHRIRLEMETLASDLAAARDEAAQASQAKSMFLANMSHELRTPLNAILGFSEIISAQLLGPNAGDRYSEYAGDVLHSGRHLLSLINDLLDVAKIESGKLELECANHDGAALLQECATMVDERARAKGVALAFEASPAGLLVFADARALRQIVINLLSNAIKFTPAGGRIDVGLREVEDGVELSVRDTGCGIPSDQIARIFKPFEQLDNHYGRANGGTGPGLTLVRALSELHGGTCRIESEPGKGTRVSVLLPRKDAAAGTSKSAAA